MADDREGDDDEDLTKQEARLFTSQCNIACMGILRPSSSSDVGIPRDDFFIRLGNFRRVSV